MLKNSLKRWLAKLPNGFFSFYLIIAALSIYPFVYTFKKPLVEPGSQELQLWGMDYKLWLITIQALGYLFARFLKGIVAAEAPKRTSGWIILQSIGVSGFSLLLFALVPAPYNIPFLFSNGISLGTIWILNFSRLDGIQLVEVLSIGSALGFIFSA